MTAIPAGSTTDAPLAPLSLAAAPDHLWRRILRSRRAVFGGVTLLLVIFLCLVTWPLTRGDSSSPLQYNRQHEDFARYAPSASGRPADVTPEKWQEQQQKLADYEKSEGISHGWRWLGTDGQARSLLGRCLFGGLISLSIGFAAAAISVVLGVTVGLIAGYRGGWVDAVLMRSVDILYGLPYILLIILFKIGFQDRLVEGVHVSANFADNCRDIAITVVILLRLGGKIADRAAMLLVAIILVLRLGVRIDLLSGIKMNASAANLVVLFLAIGLVSWLTMARVVRGQVLSLRAQPFIEAARAAGIPERRIFLKHLLPNLVGPIIVYASLTVPSAILQESFLSFLGVGIQAPLPTWGSLASEGLQPALNTIHSDWWLLLFPCTLLAITLLSLNFVGDGLRDIFDPNRGVSKL